MVVARLGERALAPSSKRRQIGTSHAGEREQHVGTLLSGGASASSSSRIARARSTSPPGDAPRRPPDGAGAARRRIAGWRQLRGDLAELRSGGRRASTQRVGRRSVERRGDGLVGSLDGERQVPRALLLVARRLRRGERAPRAPPRRRVLVAGGREQRVREADLVVVELDDARPAACSKLARTSVALAVRGDQRRPSAARTRRRGAARRAPAEAARGARRRPCGDCREPVAGDRERAATRRARGRSPARRTGLPPVTSHSCAAAAARARRRGAA